MSGNASRTTWQVEGVPWLRERMRQREYTQSDLARAMGLLPSTVNRWAKGRQRPEAELCVRLADVFGVPVEDVLALAGHTPVSHDEEDPLLRELVGVARLLPDVEKREVIDYARYRRTRVRER